MNDRFDAEDLEHNRKGRLSPRQAANGAATGFGGFVFWMIVAFLLVMGGAGGAFGFYTTLHEPIARVDLNAVYAIGGGGGLLGFGAFVLAVLSFRTTVERRRVYAQGTCESVELVFTMPELKQQFADSFLLAAGPHRVFIPRDLGKQLVNGKRYRMYLLFNQLLSFEQLE